MKMYKIEIPVSVSVNGYIGRAGGMAEVRQDGFTVLDRGFPEKVAEWIEANIPGFNRNGMDFEGDTSALPPEIFQEVKKIPIHQLERQVAEAIRFKTPNDRLWIAARPMWLKNKTPREIAEALWEEFG